MAAKITQNPRIRQDQFRIRERLRGTRWQRNNQADRKLYQKNAYRVLLTRARQGMVICVPPGDATDPTRDPSFYDPTFEYLKNIGFDILD